MRSEKLFLKVVLVQFCFVKLNQRFEIGPKFVHYNYVLVAALLCTAVVSL